jgi:ankyrin repeat protein
MIRISSCSASPHDPHLLMIRISTGFSPLYMASLRGHAECVELLLENGAWGADFNQEILIVAERRGHEKVVKLLVDSGTVVLTVALWHN